MKGGSTMNKNVWQAIKFALISLSAGIIQLGVDSLLLYGFGWTTWAAHYLPALVLSVVWNFTINRKFTFKPTNHVARDMMLVAAFYAVFTPASMWLGNGLEAWGMSLNMPEAFDTVVTVASMALNLVTEYLFMKFVVYRGEDAEDEGAADDK